MPPLAARSPDWLSRAVDNQGFGFIMADPDRWLDPKNTRGQIFDPPQEPGDGITYKFFSAFDNGFVVFSSMVDPLVWCG